MFRLLVWVCLVGLVALFGYQTVLHPQLAYNRPIDHVLHPFDTRVRYRIGHIDPRFGLSPAQIDTLVHEAVNIWHEGTGKQWFVYDEHARLVIDFVYDERQQTTVDRQKTQQKIDGKIALHTNQSAQLFKQKQALEQQFTELEHRLQAWQLTHNEAYYRLQSNQNPAYHQTLFEAYEQTLTDKHRLDEQLAGFYRAQRAYNQQVQQFNQQGDDIQHDIDNANAKFTARQFHKGVFSGKNIEIYEFSSIDELRLVLAHELGHALGIDHNDDPTALMYPIMGQQTIKNFKLKPADIALLEQRDGIWQQRAFHHHEHAHSHGTQMHSH